jgi:hypothetical protein
MSRSATLARQERIRSPAIDASSRTADQSVLLPIPAAPSMSTRTGRSPRSAARMDSRSASRPTIGVPVMVRPYSRMKAVPDDSPAGGSSSARRPYHAVRFDRRCESAAGWSWAAVALFEGAYAAYLGSGALANWGHSDLLLMLGSGSSRQFCTRLARANLDRPSRWRPSPLRYPGDVPWSAAAALHGPGSDRHRDWLDLGLGDGCLSGCYCQGGGRPLGEPLSVVSHGSHASLAGTR